MKEFKIIYKEGKSEANNFTFIKALTKGLAIKIFEEDFSDDCLILNIEG
jgi:hypothetical protein